MATYNFGIVYNGPLKTLLLWTCVIEKIMYNIVPAFHAWPSVEYVNFVFVLAGLSQMLIYNIRFLNFLSL